MNSSFTGIWSMNEKIFSEEARFTFIRLQKGPNGFSGGDIDDDYYGCPAYSHHDDYDYDDDNDDIDPHQMGPCKSQ